MTTQPNTPSNDHAQHTAARRRLRWKAAFAVPVILACGTLPALGLPEGHQDLTTEKLTGRPSPTKPTKENPELEREVIVILKEYQAEWERSDK